MLEAAINGERVLSGPEKAAAVLLMLGPPTAGRLLKHFDQPDLKVVARAAAGLGVVSPAMLDRLTQEFATDFSAGVNLLGDASQARTLLADAMPPREVDDLLGAAADDEFDVWRALADLPEGSIIAFLMTEKPATATYLLSRLDPPLAAKIVSALPRARRNAALCGLVAPHEITPLAAQLVESAMRGLLDTAKTPADRRRRTPAHRRHHQQSRPRRGRGRHARHWRGAAEGRRRHQDHALLLQRPAQTERTRAGASVRSRLDRHRRDGAARDRPGFPQRHSLVHAIARATSGRRRARIRRRLRRRGTSPRRARPSPRSCLAWPPATRSRSARPTDEAA